MAVLHAEASVGFDADLQRRFGALRRLYGDAGYARLRSARVAIVGLGGVGSWAAEALARSGVAGLTLIDLDQIAESNINRQVQALSSTVGAAKVDALAARIADIHPGCAVSKVEEFVAADNWPSLLANPVDAIIDACDDLRAKLVLASWALADPSQRLVVCGAAGGKRKPQAIEVADLAQVTHDPLLASLRQRLRKAAAWDRSDGTGGRRFGIDCVFSREAVQRPEGDGGALDGGLNCRGYGSSVGVTASFGMTAAAHVIERLLDQHA
ncbi:MAG: tRNA threonylcarbamoyladenosine dehydratase [Burkholderiaceae bacterium]